MTSGKTVAQKLASARAKSAKILERGGKIEARLAGPKTKLDLVVAQINDLAMKKDKLRKKGGNGEKIKRLDVRHAKLLERRAKLEKRVAPLLARMEKLRGRLEKHSETVLRLGAG